MTTAPATDRSLRLILPLMRAAHVGPALAVTTVVALLAVSQDLPTARGALVTAAVLAGQLTIGWGNDLLDLTRDRRVGRRDKPLATGEVSPATVRGCLAVAAGACLVLSLLVGWRSGVVHLGLGVAWGHLYNLGLKSTVWSWSPYAVAFGTLPAVVWLAGVPHVWPPLWVMSTAAALGVAAHFLNTLPDLEADAVTGVRGLPHRLGTRASRAVAITLLGTASVMAALGPAGTPSWSGWVALAIVAGLTVVAWRGRGRAPFQAAVAIALVDVLLLVVAS